MIALALLHAAALLFWLYLLARSRNLPAASAPAAKRFKKFTITYDLDCEPKGSPRPQMVPHNFAFGPSKRNRSVPHLGV